MDLVRLATVLLAVLVLAWPGDALAAMHDPYFDAAEGVLYLPVDGTPTDVTVRRLRSLVTVDMTGMQGKFSEIKGQVEGSPLLRTFWARFTASTGLLHVVVEGAVGLDAQVEVLAKGHGLAVRLSPRDGSPMPPPAGNVHQTLAIVPNDGRPFRTVTLDSMAPAPAWRAEPVASEPPLTWSSVLAIAPAVTVSYGPLSEQYVPEALSMAVPEVPSLLAAWAPGADGVLYPFRVGRRGYSFEDPDYPEVFHSHVDTSLSVAIAKAYGLAALSCASGLGYQGLWTQVSSTTAAPKPPAPSQFFFASRQLVHGPFLYQTATLPLWGPLAAELELNWAPYLWMSVDETPALPSLSAWRVAPGVRLWPGVTLGYFWEGAGGAAFGRQASGFCLGIHLAR